MAAYALESAQPRRMAQLLRVLREGFHDQHQRLLDESLPQYAIPLLMFHICLIFLGCTDTDACTVPVLSPTEAGKVSGSPFPEAHPHIKSNIPSNLPRGDAVSARPSTLTPGEHTDEILSEFGLGEGEKKELLKAGALGKTKVTIKAKL